MISLKTCLEILQKNGKKYDEAKAKIVREELTKLSQIEYEHYREIQRDKASSDLHQSFDRGTSNSWKQLEASGRSS